MLERGPDHLPTGRRVDPGEAGLGSFRGRVPCAERPCARELARRTRHDRPHGWRVVCSLRRAGRLGLRRAAVRTAGRPGSARAPGGPRRAAQRIRHMAVAVAGAGYRAHGRRKLTACPPRFCLSRSRSPRDLKALGPPSARTSSPARSATSSFTGSPTGGHLGPNLGVVELTIALHRVFDSPRDAILWDTGHQAYVHKMLTGRQDGFDRLRQQGGLSGYPSRAESEHDVIENSHASTALSYADGLAKAYAAARRADRPRGRGHRRRRADRRHGLGGAEQHRRRRTGRWSSSSTTTGAPTPRRSAGSPTTSPRCAPRAATSGSSTWGKDVLGRTPGRRRAAVRRAARHQEGHQGRRRAAGHVRGPRPEVRRAGRRPRHRRRGVARCAGPSASAAR